STLLSIPYPSTNTPPDKLLRQLGWSLILFRSILHYRFYFDKGLPVRGSIAFGPAVVEDDVFAGQCILHAYEDAQKLELAAVVLHPTAEKEFNELFGDDRDLSRSYNVPFRNSDSEQRLVLLPTVEKKDYSPWLPFDIRGYVAEAFLKHNKALSPQDRVKLDNTEMCLRFFKLTCPHLFEDAALGQTTSPPS
ncbi:MAG: hypothetical protein RDV41_11580, partial [Planctomycetota bacterium]|nr:hypothetical protein [Planctomycetota bacterium]